MELLKNTIDEVNKYTPNWNWILEGENVYLGKCFACKPHLDFIFILKENYSVEDVINSWKTEELKVECKSAQHIFLVWLYINKYGYEYCNSIKEELMDYSSIGNITRNFHMTLPFDAKFEHSEKEIASKFVSDPQTFCYHYLKGCEAFVNYKQEFPKLDTSFQGENLLVADPKKETFVGFFRDVGKSLKKAKFIIKTRIEIEYQLVNNCKQSLIYNYPNTIFRMDSLLKLQKSGNYLITRLCLEKFYTKIGNKYYDNKKKNILCPCGSSKKFKTCCLK